jgi:hypothetical protein
MSIGKSAGIRKLLAPAMSLVLTAAAATSAAPAAACMVNPCSVSSDARVAFTLG